MLCPQAMLYASLKGATKDGKYDRLCCSGSTDLVSDGSPYAKTP